MNALRIHAFGGFRVYRDDGLTVHFPDRKTEKLFCYLVLNRHRFHPREVLAELFWAGSGPKNGRHSLRTSLWRLRRVLRGNPSTDACLLAERDQIRFNPESDYWLDAEELERKVHLAEGVEPAKMSELQRLALEEAVELYRGDFLDGFYDDWCLYERERLEQMLLRTLAKLMIHHGTRGRYEEGIAYGQRIVSLDPLREGVHRGLMRYQQLAGRRAEALRQFEVCRSVLREELDIDPMPETVTLYQRIRDHRGEAEEGKGLTGYGDALASQGEDTLTRLRMALEGFDDSTGQLSLAVAAVEKLLKGLAS